MHPPPNSKQKKQYAIINKTLPKFIPSAGVTPNETKVYACISLCGFRTLSREAMRRHMQQNQDHIREPACQQINAAVPPSQPDLRQPTNTHSYQRPAIMVRNTVVLFMQDRFWRGSIFVHSFVVAEHVRGALNWYSKHSKLVSQRYQQLKGVLQSYEFGSEG